MSAPVSAAPTPAANPTTYAVGGGVVLLVIGGLVWFFAFRKPSGAAPKPKTSKTGATASSTTSSTSSSASPEGVTTPAVGAALQCTAAWQPRGAGATYRYLGNNTLAWYPTTEIASSWDANWQSAIQTVDCTGYVVARSMAKRPAEGASVRCTAASEPLGNTHSVYRYDNGVLRLYPNPTIASSWDADWYSNSETAVDCSSLVLGQPMAQNT